MGALSSKNHQIEGLRIGVGKAHAITTHTPHTDAHGLHHDKHTGHEGVAHHLLDWSNELFSRKVHEGDTLWSLSERYLGDGNKWPYLQSACELDRDPRHLIPGRPITHHCISRAKEEARRHEGHNPFHTAHASSQGSSHHQGSPTHHSGPHVTIA